MGRRKVEIKKIQDKSSRQVTFSKRRNGLIKKARDLSVLCDADVALIVLSSSGKLYDFSGKGDSLASIIRRYQSHSEAEENRAYEESKRAGYMTSEELLQIVQRYMEEPSEEDPSLSDLLQLEKELDAALTQIRSRKTELMMEPIASLLEKERVLREEKAVLEQQMIGGRKEEEEMVPSSSNCPAAPHTTLNLLPP